MIPRRLAAMLPAVPALSLLLAAIAGCGPAGSVHTMESESMLPTIAVGARLHTRDVDGAYVPRRNDIVLFRPPADWPGTTGDRPRVSRVIGVPGDRVACCDPDGRLRVNGVPAREAFVTGGPASARPFDVKVAEGRLWIMGDNRGVAMDSRAYTSASGGGTIAGADVVAVVESWT
ncbi:signal peptidase I [Actinomadura sp. ATCC 31491]|uniref:Signal peptidase I n=1 Tax=Actinomadura luzonensis TaxID=2805427 RepID=A0ABT0FX97_9ACTN|nr:signal peptidase I [Actinomadura luzonensis]MCK2216972.1 signal peptidase I [Actinomadura luzonensis]